MSTSSWRVLDFLIIFSFKNTQLQYNPNACTVYVYSVKTRAVSITLPRTEVLAWSVTLWEHAIIWHFGEILLQLLSHAVKCVRLCCWHACDFFIHSFFCLWIKILWKGWKDLRQIPGRRVCCIARMTLNVKVRGWKVKVTRGNNALWTPSPPGSDEWSHLLHAARFNALSTRGLRTV